MASVISASTTSATALNMSADTTGVLQLATGATPTTAVTIDTSQNVGIGTTSPVGKLDVTGLVRLSTASPTFPTSGVGLEFYYDTPTDMGRLQSYSRNASAWKTCAIASSETRFETGGTERMRIDSSGNVLVGTTSSVASTRMSVERIAGAGNEATIGFTSGGVAKWKIGSNAPDSFVVYTPSNVGVYINSGATSWTATSDERLKNITGNIENALDAVKTLRAVKFTWIADEENKSQVGLIAQDVQAVLPEVISEDAEGYLGIRYTETIPLLVAAIQEQQTIINDLKARIETLEGAKLG